MHEQRHETKEKKEGTWNIVVAIVTGYAMTIYLPMRRRIGKRHVGICGLFGLGWMVVWMLHTRCHEMIYMIGLFILGQGAHQIGHASGKNEPVHTRYAGDPFLAMKLFPFMDEKKARQIGEPLISLAIGLGLLNYSDGLGKYFIFGAVALMMNQGLVNLFQQQRVDDLQDGMIDNDYLMGQHRKRRGVHGG